MSATTWLSGPEAVATFGLGDRQLRRLAVEGRLERRVIEGRVEYRALQGVSVRRRNRKPTARLTHLPIASPATVGESVEHALDVLRGALAGAAALEDRVAELTQALDVSEAARARAEAEATKLGEALRKRAEIIRDLAAKVRNLEGS